MYVIKLNQRRRLVCVCVCVCDHHLPPQLQAVYVWMLPSTLHHFTDIVLYINTGRLTALASSW